MNTKISLHTGCQSKPTNQPTILHICDMNILLDYIGRPTSLHNIPFHSSFTSHSLSNFNYQCNIQIHWVRYVNALCVSCIRDRQDIISSGSESHRTQQHRNRDF